MSRQFLAFMSERAGEPLSLPAIDRLKPADLRAAILADRRMDGIGSRTLIPILAGLEFFGLRFFEREGLAKASALSSIRGPRVARACPSR